MDKKRFSIGIRTSKKGATGLVVTFANFTAWHSGTDQAALLKALETGEYTLIDTDDPKFKFISFDRIVEQVVKSPLEAVLDELTL